MTRLHYFAIMLREVVTDPRAAREKALAIILHDIVEARWKPLMWLILAHMAISYLLYTLVGETHLVDHPWRFVYFYFTVGSTIGFGDLHPTSLNGYTVFLLFHVLGALAFTTFILAKSISAVAIYVRQRMSGFGSFHHFTDHLVVIGYIPGQTERLLEETCALEEEGKVILVTTKESVPLPAKVNLVRTTDLSNTDDLLRAGVMGARAVVVMCENDSDALASSLALGATGTETHVVVHFTSDRSERLIRSYHPNWEIVSSTTVDRVGGAVRHRGASSVLATLASRTKAGNVALIDYDGPDTTAGEIRKILGDLGATLIGYRLDATLEPIIEHLSDDFRIGREHTLVYTAKEALPDKVLEA